MGDLIRLSVSEFNHLFANIVHHELQLSRLIIGGEISQINSYGNTLYLTLTHNNSYLPCVIYNANQKDIPVIKKGTQCELIGKCQYLKNKGQLLFSAVRVIPKGSGTKQQEQQQKINEYLSLGKLNLKTHIPKIIESVCLITSKGSAAYHDIESILNKNTHPFSVRHIHATMQGLNAIRSICDAIQLATLKNPDIICISRGGGSEHDFDCFFSDDIANQILSTPTPIVCGIGHQINTTLACHCANQYFETPTAMIQGIIDASMQPILTLQEQLRAHYMAIQTQSQSMLNHIETLKQNAKHIVFNAKQIIQQKEANLAKRLVLANPFQKLKSGFAYIETIDNKPITSVDQIQNNDKINLRLTDGNCEATITHVNKKTNHNH